MTSPITLTRRQFIAATTLATALPAATSLKRGYIDAHAHVWSADTKRWPRTGENNGPDGFLPDELMAQARPCGVTRVVLIQRGFYANDNSYMLAVLKEQPDLFSAVARLDHLAPGAPAEMQRLARLGVRGFRISPAGEPQTWLDSPEMGALWRFAAQRRLAICPLVDPSAIPSIERMSAQHPETTVVIDHLCRIGASGAFEEADIRALCALAARAQVHVKISGFHALGKKASPHLELRPLIRRVFDAFGAKRLMWATDAPLQMAKGNTYRASFDLVNERLDFLSSADRDWILRDTAAKVFFG